jgi:IS30 family transposase
MTAHLTVEQRQLARRLSAKGLSLREIGRQVGCSHEVVRTVVRRDSKRPLRSDSWQPGPGRLTLADREEISLGVWGGDSFTAIAARLGKAVSTVSREVAGNGGRRDYRAWRAHQRARDRARRPKTPRLHPSTSIGRGETSARRSSSTQENRSVELSSAWSAICCAESLVQYSVQSIAGSPRRRRPAVRGSSCDRESW